MNGFFPPLYLLTGCCWFTGKLLIGIQPLCWTVFWNLLLNPWVFLIDSLEYSLDRQANQLQIIMIFVSFQYSCLVSFLHLTSVATGQLLTFAWPGARVQMEAHLPHVKEPWIGTQKVAWKPMLVTTGKQSLLWKNLLLAR